MRTCLHLPDASGWICVGASPSWHPNAFPRGPSGRCDLGHSIACNHVFMLGGPMPPAFPNARSSAQRGVSAGTGMNTLAPSDRVGRRMADDAATNQRLEARMRDILARISCPVRSESCGRRRIGPRDGGVGVTTRVAREYRAGAAPAAAGGRLGAVDIPPVRGELITAALGCKSKTWNSFNSGTYVSDRLNTLGIVTAIATRHCGSAVGRRLSR